MNIPQMLADASVAPQPVPAAEVLQEAKALMAFLRDHGLVVRAMGGIALALRRGSSALTTLRRRYAD